MDQQTDLHFSFFAVVLGGVWVLRLRACCARHLCILSALRAARVCACVSQMYSVQNARDSAAVVTPCMHGTPMKASYFLSSCMGMCIDVRGLQGPELQRCTQQAWRHSFEQPLQFAHDLSDLTWAVCVWRAVLLFSFNKQWMTLACRKHLALKHARTCTQTFKGHAYSAILHVRVCGMVSW